MGRSSLFRREFVRLLATSPLLAQQQAPATGSAAGALNVMDLEPLARKALSPAHWVISPPEWATI